MERWRMMGAVFAAAFTAACASAPSARVPVVGAEDDLSALRGRWVGEYNSTMTGRSGTIVFDLLADADSARGEVWMSVGQSASSGDYRPEGASSYFRANERVEVLTIRFVRVQGGTLSGVLDPYLDPQTGIQLVTVFEGRLDGDVISGDFASTNPATGDFSTGRWRVERRAAKAQEERR